jgi:Ca-activated chloride channel family protein
MKRLTLLVLLAAPSLFAAGTLTPNGATRAPIQIREHVVDVVIDNGFARTAVTQTFFNPNDQDLEAAYSFPVPTSASLSEITIWSGEKTLQGEVIDAKEAKRVYGEEKAAGNDAGLGECSCTKPKDDIEYNSYKFSIARVRAKDETRIRFVYYQPLKIDSGVGRYVYPLQEGGTDEGASSFWTRQTKVENHFAVNLELRSGWPVDEVRSPGAEGVAKITKLADGHYKLAIDRAGGALDRDFVFYYRLAPNLPGRVELMTYKPKVEEPGTFMLTVTPGADLAAIASKPLDGPMSSAAGSNNRETAMSYSEAITVSSTAGSDYVFILDVSGSMAGKLPTLARGVQQALTHFGTGDRFRIFAFSSAARELTNGFVNASPQSVAEWSAKVQQLGPEGGTDVYAGLKAGLDAVEADRVTSILLVTDGVTNQGIVDPRAFHALLEKYDVRVFGFLMGNNSNWPLMRLIAETSGGFYDAVSNDGDIIGAILLAKSKIVSEALHDATLTIDGVQTFDRTDDIIGKIYRGQQLVIFGHYQKGGVANVKLAAKLTGQDATYTTTFDFPDVSRDYPELERLWALDTIEHTIMKETVGVLPPSESESAIRDLGLKYQLVTDYTSMVVLTDGDFTKRGITRSNGGRKAIERQAQTARAAQSPSNTRVDNGSGGGRPMFNGPSHAVGGSRGGGAIDPVTALLILGGLVASGWWGGGGAPAWSPPPPRAPKKSTHQPGAPPNQPPPRHQPPARAPAMKLVVVVVTVTLASLLLPGSALELQRGGPAWRVVTCHFTHFTYEQLVWDALVFAALGIACARRYREAFRATLFASIVLGPLAVLVFAPEVTTYRGLSGIDSALFGLLLVMEGRRNRLAGLCAVLFGVKLLVESTTGATLFVTSDAAFIAVPAAHLAGALTGAAIGLFFQHSARGWESSDRVTLSR